jgi:hypothetical protein
MAVTSFWYGNALIKALSKEINFSADTIKVALVSSSYTPNQDTHAYFSDITNEVTGTGYTSGGQSLASKTATYNGTSNVITLDAADVTWASSTITARYAIIYDDSPATAATKPLLAYVDFGADQTSTNGNFSIVWDANGILKITVS